MGDEVKHAPPKPQNTCPRGNAFILDYDLDDFSMGLDKISGAFLRPRSGCHISSYNLQMISIIWRGIEHYYCIKYSKFEILEIFERFFKKS